MKFYQKFYLMLCYYFPFMAKKEEVKKAAIECIHCGTLMKKKTISQSNFGMQVIGVLLFIAGFILLFEFPLGTILGLALMIFASRLGFKKYKAWKCQGCDYSFPIE